MRPKKRYVLVETLNDHLSAIQLGAEFHNSILNDRNLKVIPLFGRVFFVVRLSHKNVSLIRTLTRSNTRFVTVATSGSFKKIKTLANKLIAERSNNPAGHYDQRDEVIRRPNPIP